MEKEQLFDRWSLTYDKDLKMAKGPLEGYHHSINIAANRGKGEAEDSILDIGIGTGNFAEAVQEDASKIYGLDISTKMLEACHEKHPEYHLKQGRFTRIDFPDRHFDKVISSFCFHEVKLEERYKACREALRVLKDGGTLNLLDIMFVSSTALTREREARIKHWDHSEEYSLVGDLDAMLLYTGFKNIRWTQTAACHWNVLAMK